MLPPANRLRRSSDFSFTVRSGDRARSGRVVLHARRDGSAHAVVVGFVVSKAVGASVVRHRVSRRLRAQVAQRIHVLPAGTTVVVRALPGAAHATSAELGADLDAGLARLVRRR